MEREKRDKKARKGEAVIARLVETPCIERTGERIKIVVHYTDGGGAV